MKKTFTKVLCIVFLCGMLLLLASCSKQHAHTPSDWVIDVEATCESAGTMHKSCTECGVTIESAEIPQAEHVPVIDAEIPATDTVDGLTEGSHCSVCQKVLVEQKVIPATVVQGTDIRSEAFTVEGDTLTLVLSNAVTEFSFLYDITVNGNATYVVAFDQHAESIIESKTVALLEGDNQFYIFVTNGDDTRTYNVIIHRNYMFTVSFATGGGTVVENQTVEEGGLATAPATPSRDGYTFVGWDYNFSLPVNGDVEVNAIWNTNGDTPYRIEYYYENLTKNGYELKNTVFCSAETDTQASVVPDEVYGFTVNSEKSVVSGNVNGDGSLVLQVYYTRNTYNVTISLTSGTVSGLGVYPYGTEITVTSAPNLGYTFDGWYIGGELVSLENEYSHKILEDVVITAIYSVADEMTIFDFVSTETTCEIIGIKDMEVKEIIIPDYVTSIGESAFYDCYSLKNIVLPKNLTSIGNYAFVNCSDLKSISIPDSVTSIGDYAFYGCISLKAIVIPDSVKTLGNYAFGECARLQTAIIGNGVTKIADRLFYGCVGLLGVQFGENVTSIGEYAFYKCSSLIAVSIPDSVKSIGNRAFGDCISMVTIELGKGVTDIGEYAFYGCYKLVEVVNLSAMDIEVGDPNLGYIGYYAKEVHKGESKINIDNEGMLFYTYNGVNYLLGAISFGNQLILPNSYNGEAYEIYDYAFYRNSTFYIVVIGDGVTAIGDRAFYECPYLMFAQLGNNVTSIGEWAFYHCDNMVSVVIPDSVKSIGNYAFYNCSGITSVMLGNGLTDIGAYAFYGCCALLDIVIPENVKSIGDNAFRECYKLVEVINLSGLNIEKGAYSNGYVAYYAINVDTSGSMIYILDNYLFYTYNGKNYLVGYVGSDTDLVLPESFNGETYEIHDYAFYHNYNILSVVIPNNVTGIGDCAFAMCSGLEIVNIGNGVTYIGDRAFYDCINIKTIIIPEGVESIGSKAFFDCYNMTSVVIGNNVKTIGDSAFFYCSALESVRLGKSVTTIGATAFGNCSSLESIDIPDSVTSIGDGAFWGCSSMWSITMGNGITSIGTCTFYECYSLESIVIPEGVTTIGVEAFASCGELISVVIPNSVTTIGDCAFAGCSSLESIVIPESVTSIGVYAFYGCKSLTNVIFGNTLGWTVDGTVVVPSDLNDTYKAAEYLKATYVDCYWKKN